MLKITKLSTTVLIFYIFFYQQVWGDNHLVLYGTAAIAVLSMIIHCAHEGFLICDRVPYGIWNNLILVVYAIVTGFFVAANYLITLQSAITFLAFTAVCIAMCYASAAEGNFEWVLKVLIALALICSVYTLAFGTEWVGYGITLSATNNPHYLAAVLNLGIFSIVYLYRNRKSKFSAFSAALIALFMVVTIECGSRKYLLASALVVGIWVWAIVREGWKAKDGSRRTITLLGLIAFAGVAYYIIQNVYLGSDTQIRMQNNNNMDMGNQERILFYEQSWEIFLDHPLFGGGLNQFKLLSGTGMYAHSTYAEAIADFGFVGCLLYFTPIIAAVYRILGRVFDINRNYGDYILLALCLSELFIGTGQIFFMEFHHFVAWSILFFYSQPIIKSVSGNLQLQPNNHVWKYIR